MDKTLLSPLRHLQDINLSCRAFNTWELNSGSHLPRWKNCFGGHERPALTGTINISLFTSICFDPCPKRDGGDLTPSLKRRERFLLHLFDAAVVLNFIFGTYSKMMRRLYTVAGVIAMVATYCHMQLKKVQSNLNK